MFSQQEIAKKFGISQARVSKVLKNIEPIQGTYKPKLYSAEVVEQCFGKKPEPVSEFMTQQEVMELLLMLKKGFKAQLKIRDDRIAELERRFTAH